MAWRISKAPKCGQVTLKSKGREAPLAHPRYCIGQKRKGTNGSYYVSKESSNGVFRWVKVGKNSTRKATVKY